jgi:hypothetical protein
MIGTYVLWTGIGLGRCRRVGESICTYYTHITRRQAERRASLDHFPEGMVSADDTSKTNALLSIPKPIYSCPPASVRLLAKAHRCSYR